MPRLIWPPLPPATTIPPTQPGWYWFKSPVAFRVVMVEVREINGRLMQYNFNRDEPVIELTGEWQGPIPSSTSPVKRHE